MIEEDVPLNLICRPLRPGHVHFPEEKDLAEALDICFKMRAQISVVTSEMVQNELIALYNQTPNVSKGGRECSTRIINDSRGKGGKEK